MKLMSSELDRFLAKFGPEPPDYETTAARNEHVGAALAAEALRYDESQLWAKNVQRDYLSAGKSKCNLFFGEIATKLGLSVPRFANGQYWDTRTWYENKENAETLKCWSLTNSPKRGDVFIFHTGTSGHMGIVTEPERMRAVSALSAEVDDFQQWVIYKGEPRAIFKRKDLETIETAPRLHFLEYTCPDLRVDPRAKITP